MTLKHRGDVSEPRDPVAYPNYPTRPARAVRPVFHVEEEQDEVAEQEQ